MIGPLNPLNCFIYFWSAFVLNQCYMAHETLTLLTNFVFKWLFKLFRSLPFFFFYFGALIMYM